MPAVVKTRRGEVRGRVAGGVHAFKGIPYAAAPVGAHRLLPPQPAPAWSGVRDAFDFGPQPPRAPYPPFVEALLQELSAPGDDCLSLNVWTPQPGAAGLPVMVWIPGGMFEYHGTGASTWYDGSRFARDGVVCVTVNYRVGAEGFLDLGAGNVNRGLLDQIAALEWVRENIAAFGGDPATVTVFGESAGAISVAMLLAMPRAAGLFRRAVLQSGGAHHVISPESARRVADAFARELGVPLDRESIAALPWQRVVQAQARLREDLQAHPDPQRWGADVVSAMLPWQPVIDGVLIPGPPVQRIAAGAAAGVDLLAGTNVDEHRLFLVTVDALAQVTPQALSALAAACGLPVEPALDAYRAALPGASAGDLYAALLTDWAWRIPAIRLAEAHAAGARGAATFMYEFAWRSPQFGGALGACHTLEIPFVFDALGQGTEAMWGAHPPQALADAMHSAWVAFAARGDCGWPRYDLARRATMHFDAASAVVDDPRAALRALWAGVR